MTSPETVLTGMAIVAASVLAWRLVIAWERRGVARARYGRQEPSGPQHAAAKPVRPTRTGRVQVTDRWPDPKTVSNPHTTQIPTPPPEPAEQPPAGARPAPTGGRPYLDHPGSGYYPKLRPADDEPAWPDPEPVNAQAAAAAFTRIAEAARHSSEAMEALRYPPDATSTSPSDYEGSPDQTATLPKDTR